MTWEREISRKRTLKALDALGLQLANRNHTWSNDERLAFERKLRQLKRKSQG